MQFQLRTGSFQRGDDVRMLKQILMDTYSPVYSSSDTIPVPAHHASHFATQLIDIIVERARSRFAFSSERLGLGDATASAAGICISLWHNSDDPFQSGL